MPFGLQPIHIIIIIAVALIIFGPTKLPEMGRSLGKAITEFRRGTQEMAEGFKEEVVKPVKEPSSPPETSGISLTQPPTNYPQAQNTTMQYAAGQIAPAPMASSNGSQAQVSPAQYAPAPAAPAQICPQCHAENPASARFCNSCGAALNN